MQFRRNGQPYNFEDAKSYAVFAKGKAYDVLKLEKIPMMYSIYAFEMNGRTFRKLMDHYSFDQNDVDIRAILNPITEEIDTRSLYWL